MIAKTIFKSICLTLSLAYCVVAFAADIEQSQQKLNTILKISWSEGEFIRFLLHKEGHSNKNNKYNDLFSQKLLNTLARDEKQTVRENCGDEYHPEEVCGLDFNPLTCSNAPYLVTNINALKQGDVFAIYEYVSNGKIKATYRMHNKNGRWLLDGIECPDGKNYNFKRE